MVRNTDPSIISIRDGTIVFFKNINNNIGTTIPQIPIQNSKVRVLLKWTQDRFDLKMKFKILFLYLNKK